jgi:2-succinyl-5-enolpyruvyl-6-hydroxy-3-cyclohexene-1-carboxylate synthase
MNRQWLASLSDFLIHNNIHHLVVSPGSRSAPLVLHLTNKPGINVHVHVDERSAGFIALGMAQHLQTPVVLICTSGSALLNYAPAIAEAYYQQIPLLVLSADRPPEWIDQADGQSMRQHDVFHNFIRKSITLPVDAENADDNWLIWRSLSEAVRSLYYPIPGPVHVNIPFREPLYRMEEKPETQPRFIETLTSFRNPDDKALTKITSRLKQATRLMILVGLALPETISKITLERLAAFPQVVILTDITSNIFGGNFISASDELIASVQEDSQANFLPELVLTLGGPVISKRLKQWLRKNPSLEHWHISESFEAPDTFQHLTNLVPSNPNQFLIHLEEILVLMESGYAQKWKSKQDLIQSKQKSHLSRVIFSDLKAFWQISQHFPANSQLHLANSMPIRYGQFFRWPDGTVVFSNRGVSGIDGCVSTALGSSILFNGFTTVITGDLAMLYDSHSLWHQLPGRFRIIVVNNGGGGIFRIIDGPGKYREYREFFETPNELTLELLAKMHDVTYTAVKNSEELNRSLLSFYHDDSHAKLLEIFTDQETNAREFKSYIELMRNEL